MNGYNLLAKALRDDVQRTRGDSPFDLGTYRADGYIQLDNFPKPIPPAGYAITKDIHSELDEDKVRHGALAPGDRFFCVWLPSGFLVAVCRI